MAEVRKSLLLITLGLVLAAHGAGLCSGPAPRLSFFREPATSPASVYHPTKGAPATPAPSNTTLLGVVLLPSLAGGSGFLRAEWVAVSNASHIEAATPTVAVDGRPATLHPTTAGPGLWQLQFVLCGAVGAGAPCVSPPSMRSLWNVTSVSALGTFVEITVPEAVVWASGGTAVELCGLPGRPIGPFAVTLRRIDGSTTVVSGQVSFTATDLRGAPSPSDTFTNITATLRGGSAMVDRLRPTTAGLFRLRAQVPGAQPTDIAVRVAQVRGAPCGLRVTGASSLLLPPLQPVVPGVPLQPFGIEVVGAGLAMPAPVPAVAVIATSATARLRGAIAALHGGAGAFTHLVVEAPAGPWVQLRFAVELPNATVSLTLTLPTAAESWGLEPAEDPGPTGILPLARGSTPALTFVLKRNGWATSAPVPLEVSVSAASVEGRRSLHNATIAVGDSRVAIPPLRFPLPRGSLVVAVAMPGAHVSAMTRPAAELPRCRMQFVGHAAAPPVVEAVPMPAVVVHCDHRESDVVTLGTTHGLCVVHDPQVRSLRGVAVLVTALSGCSGHVTLTASVDGALVAVLPLRVVRLPLASTPLTLGVSAGLSQAAVWADAGVLPPLRVSVPSPGRITASTAAATEERSATDNVTIRGVAAIPSGAAADTVSVCGQGFRVVAPCVVRPVVQGPPPVVVPLVPASHAVLPATLQLPVAPGRYRRAGFAPEAATVATQSNGVVLNASGTVFGHGLPLGLRLGVEPAALSVALGTTVGGATTWQGPFSGSWSLRALRANPAVVIVFAVPRSQVRPWEWRRSVAAYLGTTPRRIDLLRVAAARFNGGPATRLEVRVRPAELTTAASHAPTAVLTSQLLSLATCVGPPSPPMVSSRLGSAEAVHCDVFQLRARLEASRHCEAFGRPRCDCFAPTLGDLGRACVDDVQLVTTCTYLTACGDSRIRRVCDDVLPNVALRIVVAAAVTVGVLLVLVGAVKIGSVNPRSSPRPRARGGIAADSSALDFEAP